MKKLFYTKINNLSFNILKIFSIIFLGRFLTVFYVFSFVTSANAVEGMVINKGAHITSSWYDNTLLKQDRLLQDKVNCHLSDQEKTELGREITKLLAEYENLVQEKSIDIYEVFGATIQLIKKIMSHIEGPEEYNMIQPN
jgi:hypothetical protein